VAPQPALLPKQN